MNNGNRWQPYPEYRASGVEWLGEIPAHWLTVRLKNTVTVCQNGAWGDEPTGDGNDIVCIRVADFDRTRYRVSDANLTLRSIPQNQQQKLRLSPGNLLLEKSGGGDLQPVGQVILFDLRRPAITSNFIAKMPVQRDMTRTFYVIYTMPFTQDVSIHAQSNKIRGFRILIQPLISMKKLVSPLSPNNAPSPTSSTGRRPNLTPSLPKSSG